MQNIYQYAVVFLLSAFAAMAGMSQPRIAYLYQGDIRINAPEFSQAFYDNLQGKPRDYIVDSNSNFDLSLTLLVPEAANPSGRYSVIISSLNNAVTTQVAAIDGTSFDWQEYYDAFGRDYYLKGPEFSQQLPAGSYTIEVYSKDNLGKYALLVGQKESYTIQSMLNMTWQLPLLKVTFFNTSPLQFFLTPIGIGLIALIGILLVLMAMIYYVSGLIKESIRHHQAKTVLLTSNGMQMKNEIMSLLQKPAYDITVAFISTAAKTQENLDYLKKDWNIMRDEMGFNVEEIDIEGKSESQVMKLLELKDIIFVEGGNAFYLLRAMRQCNFKKIIKKLLKSGKVYIGASAGSIVMGKTIKTSDWMEPGNRFKVKNLKGLNLVPFDIFAHYQAEDASIIKKKMPWKWQRKKLRILTDDQALLVQGKEVSLIGQGEQIVI